MRCFSILVAAAIVFSACGGAASDANDPSDVPNLTVELSDFKIVTDHASVPAGRTVFAIRNHASMLHELKVLKTDVAADKLPIDGGSAKAVETGKVGGLENIAAGASRKLVLDLAPGSYVLICNIAGHYQLGMRVSLEVK